MGVTPDSRDESLQSEVAVDVDRPIGRVLRQTWDNLFRNCPELLTSPVDTFNDFVSFHKAGGVRVIFNDILLDDGAAEVTVELIGDTFDFSGVPFLPVPGTTSEFTLTKGAIFGKSVRGEPGPRRNCQPPGGGGFDIFDLLDNAGASHPSTLVIRATALP